MKKTFLILIMFNLLIICSFGQESYIKDRWNLKTGYARYNTGSRRNDNEITVGNYRLEANYGVLDQVEAGIYFGYSKFDFIPTADSIWRTRSYSTPFYGINCNFHLLPFFVKEDDFRFDLYVTGKLGGLYLSYYSHSNILEYGLGGGFSFYLWKHLGVYTEYTYGEYYLRGHQKLRYGLTLKF